MAAVLYKLVLNFQPGNIWDADTATLTGSIRSIGVQMADRITTEAGADFEEMEEDLFNLFLSAYDVDSLSEALRQYRTYHGDMSSHSMTLLKPNEMTHEELAAEYARLRTPRVLNDATNCTSIEEEVGSLCRQIAEKMPVAELRREVEGFMGEES